MLWAVQAPPKHTALIWMLNIGVWIRALHEVERISRFWMPCQASRQNRVLTVSGEHQILQGTRYFSFCSELRRPSWTECIQ
jgi:hypothetical protein